MNNENKTEIEKWIEESSGNFGGKLILDAMTYTIACHELLTYLGLQEIDSPKQWVKEMKQRQQRIVPAKYAYKRVQELQAENTQYKTAIAEQAINHTKQVEKLEAENERLKEALKETIDLVENIESMLFHHNHSIEGWHLNGDLEPIMNFVSHFDMDVIARAKQALKGE